MNGLVLVGGKSKRMKRDKSLLIYHQEQTQYAYTYQLLEPFCDMVYLSCRVEQLANFPSHLPYITDTFGDIGPMGALLSAFKKEKTTWLVVAYDMPFLTQKSLDFLVQNRNKNAVATVFQHADSLRLEPLVTIWETKGYPLLIHAYQQQEYSLQKLLKQAAIHILTPPYPLELNNLNHPEAYQKALIELRKS